MDSVILFDPFPANGHLNSMLSLAHFLYRSGFEIVFAGSHDFGDAVKKEGFRFYFLPPFLFSPEESEIADRGALKFLLENAVSSRFGKQKEIFATTATAYQKVIGEVKPDLILLDDHFALKSFYYHKYGIPVVAVQTMFPPGEAKGIPPFQSVHTPRNTRYSRLQVKMLWKLRYLKSALETARSNFLTLGYSNFSLIKRLCPDTGLVIDKDRCFGLGIKGLPMITTSPQSLDFPANDRPSNLFYFSRKFKRTTGEIEDKRLSGLLWKIAERKKYDSAGVLIYCSLGTVTYRSLSTLGTFFKKVIKVAAENPSWEFVLSTGRLYDISQLPDTPANLRVFESVPQMQLLKHVDVMIAHGGLNSIRECIEAEVPMIIYPLTNKWDQPGNAARAVFHGLALKGNIRYATAASIAEKINNVVTNRKAFTEALRKMKDDMEAAAPEEERKILSLLNNLIPTKKNIPSTNEVY